MTNTNTRWVVAFAVIMVVLVAWAPGSVAAGHGLVAASSHTTNTELQNASTLENLTVENGDAKLDIPTYNVIEDDGDGTVDGSRQFVGDDSADRPVESEAKAKPKVSGTVDAIDVTIAQTVGSDYGAIVDVYIIQENPDGTYGEGTLVRSGWDPDWSASTQTISFDSEYTFQANKNYTVEFVTQNTDSDGTDDWIEIELDSSFSTPWYTVFTADDNRGANLTLNYTTTFPEGRYISQTHDASAVEQGWTNLTLENASAEVTWLTDTDDDGTFETTVNSATYTTSGNHTLALDTSYDDWRVNVTFENQSGATTATLHDEGVLFTSNAPSGSNFQPSDGSTLSQSTIDFKVDVTDADFPTTQGDTVTATLQTQAPSESSFSDAGQTTTSSNATVTVTDTLSEGGDWKYRWVLTDSYGESTTTSTNTLTVPSTLYIYNETKNSTGQHELLDDATIDITATITGSNQTVFETTVTDGTIDFTGLPADETYIITLESQDFHTREVYVESIYVQKAVFLLNTSIASVRNDISVTDRTGRYSDNPIIIVNRVINTSNVSQLSNNDYEWIAIGGDRLGASQVYTIDLQQDARYRFRVINQDGDTRVLGEYTAKSGGSITLEIGSISYDLSTDGEEYDWTTSIENTSTGGQLTFSYNDGANLTSELNLTIRYRNNSSILTQQTFTSGPYGEITYIQPLSQNEYDNESFIVEWNATRDGETIDGKAYEGSRQQISLPLSNIWIQVGYAGLILSFAFLVGAGVSAGAGSMVVVSFAGFGWYLGIVPSELGASAVILGLLIAGIQHMLTQSTTQRVR